MSRRKAINNIVDDYNRFGGHCPECDDFLFTYVVNYNPPKVIQECLGCDFRRDISDEIKKVIGDEKIDYTADPKLQVKDCIYSAGSKEPIGYIMEEQLDEMMEEPDPIQEYIDTFMEFLDPPSTGKLKKSLNRDANGRVNSYWLLGIQSYKNFNSDGIYECPKCGHLLSKTDLVNTGYVEYVFKKRKYAFHCEPTIKCPFCHEKFSPEEVNKIC